MPTVYKQQILQSKLNKIKASERRQEKALAWRLPDGLLDQLRENQSQEHATTDHYQGVERCGGKGYISCFFISLFTI